MILLAICVGMLASIFGTEALHKDYFTAAVLEHRPRANASDKSPAEIKAINLKFYEKAVVVAAMKGVDILVFSEFGLFPYEDDRTLLRQYAEHIPDPKKTVFNPCLEHSTDRPALMALSCMARENKMYIVANIGDVQPCEDTCDANGIDDCASRCPKDGVFMFNTNVAFNREGTVVARYHKMNVYFENLNMEEEDIFISFDTEMGRFGLIVCFDSIFEFSYKLAHEHKIDTMIFPTYWYDDIGPLKGVEWQQGWALANGVNFLAANAHTPGTGSVGSGIYSKDEGALVYSYDPDGETKLLIANVKRGNTKVNIPTDSSVTIIGEYGVHPKINEKGDHFPEYCFDKTETGPKNELGSLTGKDEGEYRKYRCFKSQTKGFELVKLEKPSDTLQACHEGFCCSLDYSAESMNEDYYLAVRNGTNDVHQHYFYWIQTCMVLRCDSYKGEECFLQVSKSQTPFTKVELKAEFTAQAIYPAVTKNKFRLADKSQWDIQKSGSATKLSYHSESSEPFLKAALFGRCYDRDPPYVPFFKY